MKEALKRVDTARIQRVFAPLKERLAPLFRSQSPVVLAHPDNRYESIDGRVVVILSPAYYWYRRSEIPLRSARAARRIAPSLFFGWLPEGQFRFLAQKESDGHYGIYALDLEEQGLLPDRIERIYFAQAVLSKEQTPMQASDESALDFIDGLCVSLPLAYLSTTAKPAADLAPFGPSIRLGRVRSAGMSRGRFLWMAALALLVGASGAVQWYHYAALEAHFVQQRTDQLKSARLPGTSFQLDAIERRLAGVAKEQTTLREHLSTLLRTPMQDAHMAQLLFESNKLSARFQVSGADAQASLASLLKERLPGAQVSAEGEILSLELQW